MTTYPISVNNPRYKICPRCHTPFELSKQNNDRVKRKTKMCKPCAISTSNSRRKGEKRNEKENSS
jgi:hypothetical protein